MVASAAAIYVRKVENANKAAEQKIKQYQETGKKIEQLRLEDEKNHETESQELQNQIEQLKKDLQAKAEAKQRNAVARVIAPAAQAAPVPVDSNSAKMFIYMHESGNNPNSVNKSSGACGLAQALPCSKMNCSLGDYVCQDAWATQYMLNRYGSWENAMAFWIAHNYW